MASAHDPTSDWRREVRRRAELAGVDLPHSTVEEIAQHLEDLQLAARSAGASEEEARARAATALQESSLERLRRRASRDPRRIHARQAEDTARAAAGRSLGLSHALRMAMRQFRQQPGFSLVTVLVLGLGTGAATTVFTVVDSVVLRPLPYAAPDRLAAIWDTNPEQGLDHEPISPVNFMDQRDLPVFADAAAWWRPGINLVDPGLDPVRVSTIEVSGNLFEVLGVRPQLGPGFPPKGKLHSNDELIAVISDRLWRTRYGADPAIIGRALDLNDTPYRVVGVMPPRFHYPDDVDVWERLRWDMTHHSRSAHFMEAVARLSDGTALEQAQAAVDTLARRIERESAGSHDSAGKGWGARLVPLLEDQLGYYRPALIVLFGAVTLLLLIGVLNVASLLLTRSLSREREMAVRTALGAAPSQLATQLMAESLVLSLAGALTGVAAAAATLPVIMHLTPVAIPRLDQATVDVRALGLCLGVAGATTVFFGLLPALFLTRRSLTTDLKSGERGSRGARRLYSGLVTAEVALAFALLVGSGLLIQTVRQMMDTPLGIEADEVIITRVQLAGGAYLEWPVVGDAHARILDQVRRHPGVIAAGGSNFLPLEVGWRIPFGVEGIPAPPRIEDLPQAQLHSVSEGYFEALGATLAAGRAFSPFDGPVSASVAIVNQTFAARYLGGTPTVSSTLHLYSGGVGPLGRNLQAVKGQQWPMRYEVVGVVRDVRNAPLGQSVEPAIYLTTRQFPFRELTLAVRASDRSVAVAAVRAALKDVAPSAPMATAQTWGERFAALTAEPRLLMTLLIFFGVLAALLAALGVYGLLSWSVALRRRELAIRLALGARPAALGKLVVRQSTALVVVGLVIGLLLVRLSEGALARVLFQISPGDPGSLLLAGALLLMAALGACVPPALRASHVDPVEGLRVE